LLSFWGGFMPVIAENTPLAADQPVAKGPATPSHPALRVAAESLGVALVYAPAAVLGLSYAVVGSTVTLVWAPSGIAMAALLLLGHRVALGVTLGAFFGNAWSEVPLAVAAGVALGNTLGALLGALLLTRLTDFRNVLDRRRDVFAFMGLAAMASTAVSAFVGVSVLWLGGLVPLADTATAWLAWWLGDMMGVLVVAPALLVWLGDRRPALSGIRLFEAVVLGMLVVLVCSLIFGQYELAARGYYPVALGVFPFVVWGALRFGQRGSSLVTLAASFLAVWGTTLGAGPFAADQPIDSLVRWCVFAIVVAVTGLLLAASMAEQRHTQLELRASHDNLERQVNERTRDLQNANTSLQRSISERLQLESELIRASEVQQQALGRELHDGLGQHLTSLALYSASLQQVLSEQALPEATTARRIVELANEANAAARFLARGLCPVALEFGGLGAALQHLTEQTRTLGRMTSICRCDPSVVVPDSLVAINLYRVAQEAINNAVKYSQASFVKIELVRVKDQICLRVSDDGIGIDFDRPAHSQGLGLRNMRYRAQLLGGTLTIEPLPLGGTSIAVTVSENKPEP
jgi:signal transduction histidine kinase